MGVLGCLCLFSFTLGPPVHGVSLIMPPTVGLGGVGGSGVFKGVVIVGLKVGNQMFLLDEGNLGS